MEILGIDAATKKTGYSILNSETGNLVDYGLIETSSVDVRDRMKEIYSKLKEKIYKNEGVKQIISIKKL